MGISIHWQEGPNDPPGVGFFDVSYREWEALQREMYAQGAVYEAEHLYEPLPTWDEFDVPDLADGTPEFARWEEACEPLLRREDPEPLGLPFHKIDSGDGHLLTPREIGAALAHLAETPKTLDEPSSVDLWRCWLDFLRAGVGHGGIRVDVGAVWGMGPTRPPEEWKTLRG